MNNTQISLSAHNRPDEESTDIGSGVSSGRAYVLISHYSYLARRGIRNVLRQPAYIVVAVAQPLIWLIFVNGVFSQVVHLRGFPADEYISYLTPGVAAMSALFSGAINGSGMLRDIQHGVVDQLLTLPTRRTALIAGRLGLQLTITLLQSTVIICVAWGLGAHFHNGLTGIVVLYGITITLAIAFAALSNGCALLLRNSETFSAIMNFILFPVTFLSTAFMPESSIARWIAAVARYNPLNWAAAAGRIAISSGTAPGSGGRVPDWVSVARLGSYLLIFAACCAIFSVYALNSYRRAI